jgi:hypothetical protein
MVLVTLSSDDGHASFLFDGEDVESFLNASFSRVLAGDEHRHVDLDAALAELLDGAL